MIDPFMTLSIREASEATGLSTYQLREAVRRGELVAVMPTGSMRGARIWARELLRYLEESPSIRPGDFRQ